MAHGCGSQLGSVLGVLSDPTGSRTQVAAVVETSDSEESWAAATPVPLPDSGSVGVSGRIDTTADVDIFDLGPVKTGDRIMLTTEQKEGLDAAAGLFDPEGNLLAVNDDRAYSVGWYDPFLNHVIREDLPHCYLALAASPAHPSTGGYTFTIQRTRNEYVPELRGQAVLLDFDGDAAVQIGSRASFSIDAFDAADIDARYSGKTDQVVDIIESLVTQEYSPYDVDIYSTADGNMPSGPVTRVLFGGYDAALLGLADNVDPYNSNLAQECVVFTDTFRLFMPLNPSADEIATALGNVAAHELGHLLGLYHTQDPGEIMDITGSAQSLLKDQTLHVTELEDSVFPIGSQDPAMLLMQALGARP